MLGVEVGGAVDHGWLSQLPADRDRADNLCKLNRLHECIGCARTPLVPTRADASPARTSTKGYIELTPAEHDELAGRIRTALAST